MSEGDQLAAAAEQFRASGLLGKPGALSRLFDFLLARTLAGEAPKELEIALEVFGKSPTFDVSQDAVVRVYVHKLRRRLDDFFGKSQRGDWSPGDSQRRISDRVRSAREAAALTPMSSRSRLLRRRAVAGLRVLVVLLAGVLIGAALALLAPDRGSDGRASLGASEHGLGAAAR